MTSDYGLVMTRGPQQGQAFFLDKDTLKLGRDLDNDIVIVAPHVSRHHTRITRQGADMVVEDLGSRNGTLVNGVRLEAPRTLASGDVIGLGNVVELTFYGPDLVMADTLSLEPLPADRPVPPPAYAAALSMAAPLGSEAGLDIVVYGLTCLVIGAASLYLSYGPWTSGSWYWAYGAFQPQGGLYQNLGGWREFIRLLILTLTFVIAQRWIFARESRKYWHTRPRFLSFYRHLFVAGPKWLCILCVVAACLAVVYHVAPGPLILFNEYASAIAPFPLSFGEHFLPYLSYLPYTFTLYILIALPMFIVVVEAVTADRKRVRDLAERIYGGPPGSLADGDEIKLQAESIETRFLDVREQITKITSKYVYMALLVILYYEIEIGSGLILQLACWAQELTKWSAWVFIIAVLPYFVVTCFRIYTGICSRSQEVLRELANRALELRDRDAADSVNRLRIEFASKYTVLSFLQSLAKSGSVAVVVFVLVFGGTYRYLENRGLIDPRRIVQTAIPWPVSPVVLIGVDLLDIGPSGAAGEADQELFDWGPRCSRERPGEDLEWEGRRIVDR